MVARADACYIDDSTTTGSRMPIPCSSRHHFRRMATGVPGARRRGLAAFIAAVAMLTATAAAAGPVDERAAAWAADDARILARAAPRLVDAALAPTFVAMDRRVGGYADWVYGWISSLLVAWDLAATGAGEARREIAAGRVPDSAAVYQRLAEVVQRQFDETVVQPGRTDRAIADGWHRAMGRVAALDASLTADRRVRIERTAVLLRIDPAPALARFGAPLLTGAVTTSEAPPDLTFRALSAVEDHAGGTADRVLVRSLRPLATRALSVTIRLVVAPAIAGLVATPVAGSNGIVGAVATLVAVSAGIWGVDYLVNRIDGTLTRPAFEAELRRLVRDAHFQASRAARRHAEATVCTALARDGVSDAACGEAPAVAGAGRAG